MGPDSMLKKAKKIVVDQYNKLAANPITENDVYIVWFCKTLQNWKALVSTDVVKGLYYEVTYNGDKKETYVDTYQKVSNVRVVDGED